MSVWLLAIAIFATGKKPFSSAKLVIMLRKKMQAYEGAMCRVAAVLIAPSLHTKRLERACNKHPSKFTYKLG